MSRSGVVALSRIRRKTCLLWETTSTKTSPPMPQPSFNLVFPTIKKGKTHKSTAALLPPKTTPDAFIDREKWLQTVISGFVSPSPSNRQYYEVILRTLWPEGHGIPGPHVTTKEIRAAINRFRGGTYNDPFRRLRELQGEEGIHGLIKQGSVYQLVDLTVAEKRRPRTSLGKAEWEEVLTKYSFKCAACQRNIGEDGFQQDHKVPRARGGSDNLENWQPLCDECNIAKSVACRNCERDCNECCWAYPEKFKPLVLPPKLLQDLRQYAARHFKQPEEIVIPLIQNAIRRR